MIWTDVHELAAFIHEERKQFLHQTIRDGYIVLSAVWRVVLTSGFCDPLHAGHLRCFQESARLGECLIVLVNGNLATVNKKGYVFMSCDERMEIISALSCVNHVLEWDRDDVSGAIEILRPNVFTKGGDYQLPKDVKQVERDACNRVGCRLEVGVGGKKIQSSSSLVEGYGRQK